MFIILAHQRSGTHLLASLLNSHPDLTCYDEIFLSNKWKLRFGRKELNKLDENEGCIVMYRHFLKLNGLQRGLITRAYIIHLMRRNLDNHAGSMEKLSKNTIKNIDYRKEQIIKYRNSVFNGKRKFLRLFEIYYEDICNDKDIKQYKNDKLLNFLGVKPILLTTNFTKGIDP